jgi:elongation factor Ts
MTMAISTESIKALREKTGAGMIDVRNALNDAEGDMDKALEILRQKGAATAEKKSSRATGEGKIAAVVVDGQVGALVEVNCETDFSANNDRFTSLVKTVVDTVVGKPYDDVTALMASPQGDAGSMTLKDLFNDTIGSVKENMTVSRFVRYQAPPTSGMVHAYIHGNGKIGVLLEATAGKPESLQSDAFKGLLKDVGMQIAAYAAEFITRDEIPQSVIDEETRIEMGKEDIQSKPEAIRPKIVAGRVDKNIDTRVLLRQEFIKDPSKKVEDVIAQVASQLGDTITIARFTRYVLGEAPQPQVADEPHAPVPATIA